MTQEEVAHGLHITLRSYQNYEQGRTSPPLHKLAALAIVFNVSTDWLLGLTDDPTPHARLVDE